MARDIIAPYVEDRNGTKVHSHPAYGNISITRVSGRSTLYGSDFQHNSSVRISIAGCETYRNLSHDHYFADNVPFTVVEMSEAQWATFISSIGLAGGVPCTIRRRDGETLPLIAPRDEAHEYKNEINESARKVVDNLKQLRERVGAGIQGLSKAKQADILDTIDASLREIDDVMPFVANSFAEYMEERVEKAKAEINVHVSKNTNAATELSQGQETLAIENKS